MEGPPAGRRFFFRPIRHHENFRLRDNSGFVHTDFGNSTKCVCTCHRKTTVRHSLGTHLIEKQVGNTASYDINKWKSDITLAKSYGIDAFVLNIAMPFEGSTATQMVIDHSISKHERKLISCPSELCLASGKQFDQHLELQNVLLLRLPGRLRTLAQCDGHLNPAGIQ